LSSLDVSKVRAKIDEIKHDINAKKIVEYVKQYTNRSTFIRTDKHISKEISLNMAAEKLENLGYVNDDFLENLKQRENMASTLFGLVAIPHPLKMNA
ncbi:PTS transporter subunit EIIA, partial [Salmonella enterica subsp. enterica serovar Enteritidis]|nr:PTS transporter subunit EIIA [Salmonella enterica subsp. enterica serovar Enteritidis]